MKAIPEKAKTQIKRIALGLFFIGMLSQVLTAPKPADEDFNKAQMRPVSPANSVNYIVPEVQSGQNSMRLVVNLNTCSEKELCSLPGIGKKLAGRILDFRSEHRFQRKEDLMFVKGIGSLKYAKLKDLIIAP